MSDMGLHASIYEQLRAYADALDRGLVSLRSKDKKAVDAGCAAVVALLREMGNRETSRPCTKLVAMILRQELPHIMGHGMDCGSLVQALDKRQPTEDDLAKLEQMASVIDRECLRTYSRIRGSV